MEIAALIVDGIRDLPEDEPGWLGIAETGAQHERCAATRAAKGRRRCLDARCDRCWP